MQTQCVTNGATKTCSVSQSKNSFGKLEVSPSLSVTHGQLLASNTMTQNLGSLVIKQLREAFLD